MPTRTHGRGHGIRDIRFRGNKCFVCGPDNAAGMHLKFTYIKKRKTFLCRFRLDERYTGPPGHCHGGIIATILDEAMGKVNKLRRVTAVTAQMKVDYVRPVPLNQALRVESRQVSSGQRKHVNTGEILNPKGEVLARGEALFISIDAERLFGRFVKK
jgi:uncharacterized protein (TIGR00369 family)